MPVEVYDKAEMKKMQIHKWHIYIFMPREYQ
jgi:hypothetical protein